ncbi:hypothetical protein ACROYT_G039293 [Oculina patagonica]
MRFVLAIQLISVLLMFQPDTTLQGICQVADWMARLDMEGSSVCPNNNTYLAGLLRNARAPGDERVGRIEYGICCPAIDPASSFIFTDQPATCKNANWSTTLDGNNVWALCPDGYFLNGFRKSDGQGLSDIEEAKCCRPQNQPEDSYDDCFDEDVSVSFDDTGLSYCSKKPYYMTGIYKSTCDEINCIEKFKCCRMKSLAVDGGWSDFGDWSECSVTCGDGQQERSRTCTNPPPAYGGAECTGSNKETKPCNNGPCPVDGGWSDFGDWSECSVTCEGGIKERRRTCTNPPPSNCGAYCVGDNVEAQSCNAQSCSVDGGWTNWSAYGECSKTCGKGKKYKTRTCTNPPPSEGGKNCKGKSKKRKRCNEGKCQGL